MIGRLGGRAVDGVVVVVADESRSQWRNRALARRRLAEWLEEAMKRPTTRRTTRPTRASQDERVAHKRARSEVKQLRRPPEPD
jgi:ribosome-associated protein